MVVCATLERWFTETAITRPRPARGSTCFVDLAAGVAGLARFRTVGNVSRFYFHVVSTLPCSGVTWVGSALRGRGVTLHVHDSHDASEHAGRQETCPVLYPVL